MNFRYKISVEISKSEFTENDSCIVEVKNDVPVVEFEEIECPINPAMGVEIHATIYELKTFCSLQWTAPELPGYESLDLTSVVSTD